MPDEGDAAEQTVRVALRHAGTEADAAGYARDVRAIVEAVEGIYGMMPRFDHGTYTFLADYLPAGRRLDRPPGWKRPIP